MKTKKSSLSLILALVMMFVMASGAFATLNVMQKADGTSATPSLNLTEDVAVSGKDAFGLYALDGGEITIVGNISADGQDARTIMLTRYSSIDITGNADAYGVGSRVVTVYDNSFLHMIGNITAHDENAWGLLVQNFAGYENAEAEIFGNINTYGTSGHAVVGYGAGKAYIEGNLSVSGENARAISAQGGAVISVALGTITAADTSLGMLVNNAEVNLKTVTVEASDMLQSNNFGVVNVMENSTLNGNILHACVEEGALEINLSDSVWNGSAEASGDIGVIDINLENSQWNVTGDTNTNGKITGDADSKVDFNGTEENITVIIDRLEGESGISVKPGDKLIIKNPAGNVESSNPDVIEVITNDDGSVEIISKGDGEADLTYQYVDEDGKIKEVTVTVVSGAGSQPSGETSRGGGSSNCNTGVGAALFALLGLAFIQKRK